MGNVKVAEQARSSDLLALNSIARSVAYLALQAAELSDSDLTAKVHFLERMGLGRSDCAKVLETTEESIRVTLRHARNKKKPRKAVRRG